MLLELGIKYYNAAMYRDLVQFIKYCVAGGIATLVHILLFFILAWKIFPALRENDCIVMFFGLTLTQVDLATRSFNSMLSNGIGFICSNMVAYILNILWVFESGKNSKLTELLMFYLTSGLSVAAGTGIIGFMIRYYNVETTFAFSINIFVSLSVNYIIRKYIIFKS